MAIDMNSLGSLHSEIFVIALALAVIKNGYSAHFFALLALSTQCKRNLMLIVYYFIWPS